MNYPLWSIPGLGGSWAVGLISVIHVFISHFAVGGGIFFALTEYLALKRSNSNDLALRHNSEMLYAYLRKHSKFFMMVTTVAGAVTGVGIWFSISLVSPDGTASLIQTYSLGWATEYLFFVAEIATVLVYFYTWDKVSKELHLALAQWYAVLSVFTLIIINGILSFMLTPGGWIESKAWYEGFFNPTYWPSLILRLLVMLAIAGMYSLITSARLKASESEDVANFRAYMLKYSSKWFIPVFLIGPIVGFWFFSQVPQAVITNIFTGIQSSGVGNFSILARAIYLSLILSGTVLVFALVGPYLNPRGFSFGSAVAFLVCGLGVTSMSEWSREMLRKPYVIYNYMYSNGIRKADLETINKDSFAAFSKWEDPDNIGVSMFRQQCMICHTTDGYRSMKKLLGERDLEGIKTFLLMMRETDPDKNSYLNIMPPLVGTDKEVEALAEYLVTLKPVKLGV
jgi:cytochrome bd-type quinol oxidase subunit 1